MIWMKVTLNKKELPRTRTIMDKLTVEPLPLSAQNSVGMDWILFSRSTVASKSRWQALGIQPALEAESTMVSIWHPLSEHPLSPTGPGVVIIGYNGCPTWGYLGSTCGYRSNWGGNQVIVVVSMPNGLYALTYAHLQNAAVSAGTVISKGTVLGTMGSSGNSTGSHLAP